MKKIIIVIFHSLMIYILSWNDYILLAEEVKKEQSERENRFQRKDQRETNKQREKRWKDSFHYHRPYKLFPSTMEKLLQESGDEVVIENHQFDPYSAFEEELKKDLDLKLLVKQVEELLTNATFDQDIFQQVCIPLLGTNSNQDLITKHLMRLERFSIDPAIRMLSKVVNSMGALALGVGGYIMFFRNFGVDVITHEVVGHLMMGAGLLNVYANNSFPPLIYDYADKRQNMSATWQADAVDNLLNITQNGAGGLWDFMNYANHRYPESLGWANRHYSLGASQLSQQLGSLQSSALFSLSGIIPVLALLSGLGLLTAKLSQRFYLLNIYLIGLLSSGLFFSLNYPWSVVMMPAEQRNVTTQGANDFINFSDKMARYKNQTGIYQENQAKVATETAFISTLIPLMIILLGYLYFNSDMTQVPTDQMVIHQFYKDALNGDQKAEKELQRLISLYPKSKYQKIKQTIIDLTPAKLNEIGLEEVPSWSKELSYFHIKHFNNFLFDHLSYDLKEKYREDILAQFEVRQRPRVWQRIWQRVNFFSSLPLVSTPLLVAYGQAGHTSLGTWGTVFASALPAVMASETAESAYTLYQDVRSQPTFVPFAAKILSGMQTVADLISTAATLSYVKTVANQEPIKEMIDVFAPAELMVAACAQGVGVVCRFAKMWVMQKAAQSIYQRPLEELAH